MPVLLWEFTSKNPAAPSTPRSNTAQVRPARSSPLLQLTTCPTDNYGTSIYAANPLPPHTIAVSCPFALAITPKRSRRLLEDVLPAGTSEHALMATYLALHRIFTNEEELPATLKERLEHWVYVETLPRQEEMRTPCWFSEAEMSLLEGTNLAGATRDRLKEWKEEWELLLPKLVGFDSSLLTWCVRFSFVIRVKLILLRRELYLWASTILSSRAFASHLIDGDRAGATPILFPGVDTLNHRYGEKVSWIADEQVPTCGGSRRGMMSIVLDNGVAAGAQGPSSLPLSRGS